MDDFIFIMPANLEIERDKAEVGHIIWAFYRVLDDAIKVPMTVLKIYGDGTWKGECTWAEA